MRSVALGGSRAVGDPESQELERLGALAQRLVLAVRGAVARRESGGIGLGAQAPPVRFQRSQASRERPEAIAISCSQRDCQQLPSGAIQPTG
jgi:hypothetical protein